jgi:very-short-patch-repair endonuclease
VSAPAKRERDSAKHQEKAQTGWLRNCSRPRVSDGQSRAFFNLKSLKERRRELRNNCTAAEALLWKHLQKRKVLSKKFRRQHSIGPFIVDFYCPECRVIVELDGGVHDEYWVGEYDAAQAKFLEQNGMLELWFENSVVFDNIEAVLEAIKVALLSRIVTT